jgi:CBS domain containing-hemolysin-like protein
VKFKKSRNRVRHWIIAITLWTFFLAVILSLISEAILLKANILIALIILTIIMLIGILFDIIGVAVTAAHEAPFHAMSAGKVKGAKQATMLLKNADRVSNFCNDVVGDICGIISGAVGAAIVFRLLISNPDLEKALLSAAIAGFISSVTVGGKAIGKNIALKKSKDIVLKTGYAIYLLSFISRLKKKK